MENGSKEWKQEFFLTIIPLSLLLSWPFIIIIDTPIPKSIPEPITTTLGETTTTIPDLSTTTPVNLSDAIQQEAIIGKQVKWIKKLEVEQEGNFSFTSLHGRYFSIRNIAEAGIIAEEESGFEITLEEGDYEVEYETPAPTALEENLTNNKKRITISGPDELHYVDVLAYTELPSEAREQAVHLYWLVNNSRIEVQTDKHDTNDNSLIDYIEWVIPHLSNQTYELIVITKAEHLDDNRSFISDIYEAVKELDENWSEPIYHKQYVRVNFESVLTSEKDITVYVRNTQQLNTTIEVYEYNGSELIASFPIITDEGYYKIYLTNLSENHAQDVFDLRINNLDNLTDVYLEFDHIVDPLGPPSIEYVPPTPDNATTQSADSIYVNVSASDDSWIYGFTNLDDSLVGWWRLDNDSSIGENDTFVYDWSGNGNNGTVFGANATPTTDGKFGGGFSFDGKTGNYVEVPFSQSLNITAEFTLSVWVRPEGLTGNDFQGIVYRKNAWQLVDYQGDTTLFFLGYNDTNNYGCFIGWAYTPTGFNAWDHIVVTWNSTGCIFYANAVFQKRNETTTSPPSATSTYSLNLGRRASNEPFNGTIDEVLIFNRSLSQQEVEALYNASAPRFQNNYTNLSEGTHTFKSHVVDAAGNKNETESREVRVDTVTPSINFTGPTPPNGTTTSSTPIEINVSIIESDLEELEFNWNGTNFTLYDDSLVLMMNLDNVSALGENNTYVVDVSGYGNDGTAINNSIPTSAGKFGGAFDFDGGEDMIIVENDSSLNNITGPITLSVWVKADASPGGWRNILTKWGTASMDGLDDANMWYVAAQNELVGAGSGNCLVDDAGYCVKFVMEDENNQRRTYGNTLMQANEWYHITAVYNGSHMLIYVNGILDNTPEAKATGARSNDTIVGIGAKPNFGYGFPGLVDEVRIWNRSLSNEEVQQLYFTNLYKYDTDKWALYVNQSKNSTHGLDDGTYTYQAFASDNAGNMNSTEEREVTIDTTYPAINYTSPTPDNDTTQSRDYIYVNVSASDDSWIYGFTNFDDSLVAWYRLDSDASVGESTSLVYDWSGGKYNLTPINEAAPTTAGMFDGDYHFDGDNDRLERLHPGINFSKGTISAWVYCESGTGVEGGIFTIARGGGNAEWLGLKCLYDSDAMRFNVDHGDDDCGKNSKDSSGVSIQNSWHHVAGTFNADSVMELYVDSISQGTIDLSSCGNTEIKPETTNTWSIGTESGNAVDFEGRIDEAILFNRSLSTEEIEALYNASAPRFQDNYTTLSEGTHTFQSFVIDEAGNKNETELREVGIDAGALTSCGLLDTANEVYTLQNNVSSTGTCFNVTANNVTLDCQGYEINYSNAGTLGYGVYSDQNYTAVTNCVIKEGNAATNGKHAVYLNNVNNGSVYNNSITLLNTNSYAFYLSNVNYTGIRENTVNASTTQYSIYLTNSNFNTLANNSFTRVRFAGSDFNLLANNTITGSGTWGYVVDIRNTDWGYFSTDNNITNNYIASTGWGGYGIHISTNEDRNTIINNTINTTGVLAYGIYLYHNTNAHIENNVLYTTSSRAIYIDGSAASHFDHTITDDNTVDGKPINVINNGENVIFDGLNEDYGQIVALNSNNITIKNSNISDDGILFGNTHNSTIDNNNISGPSVAFSFSSNSYVTNNIITSSGDPPIYFRNSDSNNIANNNITASGYDASVFEGSSSNNYTNNTVSVSGTWIDGLYISDSSNFTISNVDITTTGGGGTGISLVGTSNSIIQDAVINTTSDSLAYGIAIRGNSYDNVINNSNIKTTGATSSYGIYIDNRYSGASISKSNTSIYNSVINATAVYDISTGDDTLSAGSFLKLINVSFNKSDVYIGDDDFTLYVEWYLDVYINNTGGQGIDGATVTGWQTNGSQEFNGTTNISGYTNRFQVMEYIQNSTDTVYYTNYTVNASATLYITGSKQLNLTTNYVNDNFSITLSSSDTTYPAINYTSPTPDNGTTQPEDNIYVNVSASDENQIYGFTNFDDSLVGWWRLDNDASAGENSTFVYDWSGKGNNGTAYNGALPTTAGKFGGGYEFDGQDAGVPCGHNFNDPDRVAIPYSQDFRMTNFTISVWAKFNQHNDARGIISRYIADNDEFSISTAYNEIGCGSWNDGAFGARTKTTIENQKWYHFVCTFNHNGPVEAMLFLNGVNEGNDTSISFNPLTNNQDWIIGKRWCNFNGTIDEVLIFNRSLSAEEIEALYNASAPRFQNNYTNLTDGNHTFKSYVVDAAGNKNETEERSVVIDTIYPEISFVSPTPQTGNYTQYLTINVSASDANWIYGFTNLDDSLVGWWRMDNDASVGENTTLVYDWSGKGHNGTAEGNAAPTTAGKFGGGFEFDNPGISGEDDYVNIDFTAPSEGTFSAWVISDFDESANLGSFPYLFDTHDPLTSPPFTNKTAIMFRGGSYKTYVLYVNGSFSGTAEYTPGADIIGWWHIAVTWNSTGSQFYKDGESVGVAGTIGVLGNAGPPFYLGARSDLNRFWDGTIDEVLIFNRSLSSEEIEALYNASAPRFQNNYTNLADGLHTFRSYVVDAGGNKNETEQRSATVDATPPSTSVNNVEGDTAPTYYDTTNDGSTDVIVDGEENMSCRYGTSDVVYSSMTNDCTITGIQANCSINASEGTPDYYVSCVDWLGNEQNTSQNLNVVSLVVDWTAPNTTDNSTTDVHVPTYTVTISEYDNIDGDPTTYYCKDTIGNCSPETWIDNNGFVDFNETERGTNYLRYYSVDDAGNNQTVVNRTIRINQLPNFTSADDNASIVMGGSTITITTVAYDLDGQTLKLFVCKNESVNYSGCFDEYCSNTTATNNPSCSFTTETDNTIHYWYAFLYDSLNESALTNESGNYTTDSIAPTITIHSPLNATYSQTWIYLYATLSENGSWVKYSLNGENVSMDNYTPTDWYSNVTLSNGSHQITFYASDLYGSVGSDTISFTIDISANDTIPPVIIMHSPVNGSYHNRTYVMANITLTENGSWVGYCLDNCVANQTMNGLDMSWYRNVTNLSEQLHQMLFYANDSAGNVGNSSVTFTVDETAPQYTLYNNTPNPKDNESVTCYSHWTDNVELSNAIIQENLTGTFRNHTIALSGTSGWANYTDNVSTPGAYQCRVYSYDTTGNPNATPAWTFNVADVTPPNISNISYYPTSLDDIDPNTTITVNATVTDTGGISKVLLQYMKETVTVWNNVTMTNISSTYQGNFTPTTSGIWIFRVMAIDNSNNTVESTNTSLNVTNEYTWTRTPAEFNVSSALIGTNGTIGNLTINNTGDFLMEFRLTSNREWIYYNGSLEPFAFNLTEGNTTITEITGTAPLTEGEYAVSILINNTNENATPSYIYTNATFVSFTSGPYLFVTITTYSSEVIQGQRSINLVAMIKNIGNEDAAGVWLMWILPEGWTSRSALNRSIGNLGVGETAWNSLVVDIGEEAPTGNQTLSIMGSSIENMTAIASKRVSVRLLVVGGGGDLPPVPARPGWTPEPELPPPTYNMSLEVPALVRLGRGETKDVTMSIKNTGEYSTLRRVYINITGFPIRVIPPWFARITYTETKNVTLRINATQAKAKDYPIQVIVTSEELNGTENFTLRVYEFSQQFALESVEKANKDIKAMEDAGFVTIYARGLLKKAIKALDEERYGDAVRLYNEIHERMENAFRVNDLINTVRRRISEAETEGLSITIARDVLEMAISAFEAEDYERAEEYTQNALLIKIETAPVAITGRAIAGRGVVGGVPRAPIPWARVILVLTVTIVAASIGYMKSQTLLIPRKIEALKRKRKVIDKLIKEAEDKYYVKETISEKEYRKTVDQYEEKKAKLKEKIIHLKSKKMK